MFTSLCPVTASNRPTLPAVLKTPPTSGARLIEPPLERVGELLAANRLGLEQGGCCDLQGLPLAELAAGARRQLVAAALEYSRSYRDLPDPPAEPAAVLLAGHQPELFHPGVWLKNFVLGELARRHEGVAVNLVIDGDTIKSSSLRVPGGSASEPTVEGVPFDRPSAEIPFETRSIQDAELFASFGRRAAERIAPLVADPLVRDFWPLAIDVARRTSNLGQCLSQSRHQWEGRWGLTTLELPQSRLCCLEAFHRLTAHLLAHLPRFWDVYNTALAEYRREHGIRSHAHPAPELASEDSWLEAPYWIWADDNPLRRRAFVAQRGDELILTDREGLEIPLSLAPESDSDAGIEQLAALARRGIRLRSRALLTTLAARLLFGDLFLHGIGGAKYDRLTDTIIERFFCVQPPAYMVVSGTLHLPIAHERVTIADLRRAEQQLRELQFHPERFLADAGVRPTDRDGAATARLIEEKRHWIEQTVAPADARRRCRAIRRANESLQPRLAERRAELTARAESQARRLRAEAVLSSREYGFCLYPEKIFSGFLLEFPAAKP